MAALQRDREIKSALRLSHQFLLRMSRDSGAWMAVLEERPPGAGSLPGLRPGCRSTAGDGEHVAVQPLSGRLDPALEPVTLPALRFDAHRMVRALHERKEVRHEPSRRYMVVG
jgi:hypothetical protein